MTAFGAVISLKNTIDYIVHSSHFSLVEPSVDIIQLAYNELQPLHDILQRLDVTSKSKSRRNVNAWDGRIKESVWELEDLLESTFTDQILSQSRSSGGERAVLLFSIDLRHLEDDVHSFIHTLKDMEKRYMDELLNMPEDDEEESRIDLLGGMQSKMTGLSDQFKNVKRKILMQECGKKAVYALVGTAGVGKTTLAEQIFQDPEIKSYFKHRAWVRVGRKHQLDQLSLDILAQLFEITLDEEKDDDNLEEMFERKKCLIVLDDVWEQQIMDPLIDSLPYIKRGLIQILVTAREWKVIKNTREMNSFYTIDVVRFLNEQESKVLKYDLKT